MSYLLVAVGQESRLMWGVCLLKPHFRGRLGWHLTWTSVQEGSSLRLACGVLGRISFGHWIEGLSSQLAAVQREPSTFLACEPPHMATCFIKGSKTESLLARGKSRRRRLLTKVTAHPFCHIVSLQVLPTHMGRVLHGGVKRRWGRPLRPSWSLFTKTLT